MTSALDGIYDAIKGMSTTWSTDVTVSAWNYDELDSGLQPNCPQRALSITGSLNGDFGFVAIGTLCKIEWIITDTLFLKQAAEGESLTENSANIVKYIVAYVDALRALRAPTTQSHITGLTIKPGVYYWPDDPTAGIAYIGVQMLVTVEDIISD